MIQCSCGEWYDPAVNDGGRCYACVANSDIVQGVPGLDDLPPHQVTERGINVVGQIYHRVRFIDGSTDLRISTRR